MKFSEIGKSAIFHFLYFWNFKTSNTAIFAIFESKSEFKKLKKIKIKIESKSADLPQNQIEIELVIPLSQSSTSNNNL